MRKLPFGKIEKFTQTKIPVFLKKILKSTGFNSEFALINISEQSIKLIEELLGGNRNLLEKTKYENRVPFKFDIGDRSAILNIPKLIKEANKARTEKKNNEAIQNFDEKKLKKELVEKIKKILLAKTIQYNFEEKDIIECVILNEKIRCKVQCSTCKSIYSCVKDSYWQVSNFSKHICDRKCKKKTATGTSTVTSNRAQGQASSAFNRIVIQAVNSNQLDLNRILAGQIAGQSNRE